MGLKDFNGVFFYSFCFREALIIVEVDKVGGSIVLASLSAFRTVPSEVSHFSALEAGIQRISRGGCIALEVALWAVSLVLVGVLSSSEVVAPIISSVVSSGWCPVSVYIHRDWGVIHPTRGV